MITYLKGDATAPQTNGPKVIAHVVNDIGGWGKGFVVAISRRWPKPEASYRQWHAERATNDFALGSTQIVQVEPDLYVANMIGQRSTRSKSKDPPIRYDALEACLRKLHTAAEQLHATVHMPRIGCGLAGGKWEIVEPLIQNALQDVPVFVYDFEP